MSAMTDDIFDGLSSEDQDALEKLGAELPEFVMKEVRKQVGPLLQESVAQMRKFQDRINERNEGEKQSLLCSQVNCLHAAKWSYVWPGQAERLLACDDCMQKANGIAKAMNFNLGDVKQLSHEIPIEVKIECGSKGKVKQAELAVATVPEFSKAMLVVISITTAEAMAMVVTKEHGARCYPISKLRIQFNYMDDTCVISLEGNPSGMTWMGIERNDYMAIVEPNSLRFVFRPNEIVRLVVETDA